MESGFGGMRGDDLEDVLRRLAEQDEMEDKEAMSELDDSDDNLDECDDSEEEEEFEDLGEESGDEDDYRAPGVGITPIEKILSQSASGEALGTKEVIEDVEEPADENLPQKSQCEYGGKVADVDFPGSSGHGGDEARLDKHRQSEDFPESSPQEEGKKPLDHNLPDASQRVECVEVVDDSPSETARQEDEVSTVANLLTTSKDEDADDAADEDIHNISELKDGEDSSDEQLLGSLEQDQDIGAADENLAGSYRHEGSREPDGENASRSSQREDGVQALGENPQQSSQLKKKMPANKNLLEISARNENEDAADEKTLVPDTDQQKDDAKTDDTPGVKENGPGDEPDLGVLPNNNSTQQPDHEKHLKKQDVVDPTNGCQKARVGKIDLAKLSGKAWRRITTVKLTKKPGRKTPSLRQSAIKINLDKTLELPHSFGLPRIFGGASLNAETWAPYPESTGLLKRTVEQKKTVQAHVARHSGEDTAELTTVIDLTGDTADLSHSSPSGPNPRTTESHQNTFTRTTEEVEQDVGRLPSTRAHPPDSVQKVLSQESDVGDPSRITSPEPHQESSLREEEEPLESLHPQNPPSNTSDRGVSQASAENSEDDEHTETVEIVKVIRTSLPDLSDESEEAERTSSPEMSPRREYALEYNDKSWAPHRNISWSQHKNTPLTRKAARKRQLDSTIAAECPDGASESTPTKRSRPNSVAPPVLQRMTFRWRQVENAREVHDFVGASEVRTRSLSTNPTPYECFQQFFTNKLIQQIVDFTNLNARRKINKGPHLLAYHSASRT